MKYDGITYYFGKNIFGDVVEILSGGNVVAKYTYNAWGEILSVTDANGDAVSSTHVANVNPFRYRGYYYDTESGFYYLNSRYYDPVVKRFINADGQLNMDSLQGVNMYAYCEGNPISLCDPAGNRAVSSNDTIMIAMDSGTGFREETWYSWIEDVIEKIDDYVFNEDEQKVLDAEKFAFYKGVPVIKIPGMGKNMCSFGAIFIGEEASTRSNAIEDVKHEYGHSVHFSQIGICNYTIFVAIPSVIGYYTVSAEQYYSQPWEYIAEVLGGVNNRMYNGEPYPYASYAPILGALYWIGTVVLR